MIYQFIHEQVSIIIQMDKNSKIAVVGAGISGLALSIALKQLGFSNIKIFEKDASFDSRRQGYGLTILQGKSALRTLGVLQQVKKYNAPSKAHYIFDPQGSILGFYGTLFWDHKNNNRSLKSVEKGLSMHVPRQCLRKVLLDRYKTLSEQSQIEWNSTLSSIDFSKQLVHLSFANNNRYDADIVFGCDGINSLVRKAVQINPSPLNYLGVMVVLGLCKSDHELTKNRVFQTADGQFRLFSMPFIPNDPQLGSMWQLSFPIDRKSAQQYTQNIPKLKQFLCHRLSTWHTPIPQMVLSTKLQNLMSIPAYDRDPIWPQLKDNRIILLGDAHHPMSPFKGQGANQALMDAIQISHLLQNKNKEFRNWQPFLQKISERAFRKVIQSRQRVSKYHQQSFKTIDNFLYPGIDSRLIRLLKDQKINAQNSQKIEQKILSVMKQHKYA